MFELFRNSSSFHIIFEFSKYITLLGKPVRIAVAGKVSFEVLPDKSFFWAILLPFLGERAGIGFAGAGTVFFVVALCSLMSQNLLERFFCGIRLL